MADVLAHEVERLPPRRRRPDWADVRHRARPRRTSAYLIAAVVTVAAVVPGAGLQLGRPFALRVRAEPDPRQVDTVGVGAGRKRLLRPRAQRAFNERRLVRLPGGHADAEPAGRDVRRWRLFVDPRQAVAPHLEEHSLLDIGMSVARRLTSGNPANWVPPIVSGAILPSLHATRVAVVWHGGSLPLVLRGDRFVGGGAQLYMPPLGAFPFVVTAYDAQGRVVATKKLDSPGLLLLRHGWKEYARLYHAWQKQHRH